MPIGVELERHLTVEIERMLTEDLHNDDKELGYLGYKKLESIKIADISFAYNNAALISKLRKRGT